MTTTKSFPEGLKMDCEWKWCWRVKFAPLLHSQEGSSTGVPQTLLTLLEEWASKTQEKFLLYVHSVIHMCMQMGFDTTFAETKKAVETALLDAELTKGEFVQVCYSKKKNSKDNRWEGPKATPSALAIATAHDETVMMALEAAKLAITTAGVKPVNSMDQATLWHRPRLYISMQYI